MGQTAIKVGPECIQAFDELKLGHKYKYIIFNFASDLLSVTVEKTADANASYDDLLNDLPPKDVRYVVLDYQFKSDDGSDRGKLVFIVWAPDTAPVKRKMLIAATKLNVKNALNGVQIEVQATDDSEISEDHVLEKAKQYAKS